ncbi:hypothetical protein VQH23_16290 [Pararoseomonas sp. SCSIO 73927]|uniref:hypothetical protein n=1 Tax=Pararoseomonas sp. SCSIO 73927 TaxID=3114537 RepID=UPI0030CFA80A
MSITTAPSPLDLDEQIARIRRAQAETDKFAAEQRKLSEEANNLRVARYVTPTAAVIAALAALTAAFPVIARWLGGGG